DTPTGRLRAARAPAPWQAIRAGDSRRRHAAPCCLDRAGSTAPACHIMARPPGAVKRALWPPAPDRITSNPMHATVVVFPGSNADSEMVHTLRDVVQVRTSVVWHRDTELPAGTDLVAVPGGFSYGDYLRCGAIARASPILGAIRRHADRGGLVLGVCNGF